MRGTRSGYVHTYGHELDKDGIKLLRAAMERRLTVARSGEVVQLGMDTGTYETADGKVVGAGDMRAQCEQVFKNLANVLRAAGAGWNDVIKMNGYMVGINAENVAAYREVRSGYLKAKQLPASTLVGVTSLVQPELLLEVEVVAALGS